MCAKTARILLANLLQCSRSTFACVRFPSVFAFQDGMWDTQFSALLSSPTVSARILLVNLLQSSRSTFSCESFLSFFAFNEGMLDTQISALGGWPTVSARYLYTAPGLPYGQHLIHKNSVQESTSRWGIARQ